MGFGMWLPRADGKLVIGLFYDSFVANKLPMMPIHATFNFQFISHRARRGRRAIGITSYFTLHTFDFDSEMYCVSRGGTETRSWAVCSIFNLSRTGHAEGAEQLASLPTSRFMLPTSERSLHPLYFTLPTLYGVIPCRVLAPGAWNLPA